MMHDFNPNPNMLPTERDANHPIKSKNHTSEDAEAKYIQ
jgi:hypothetical protein